MNLQRVMENLTELLAEESPRVRACAARLAGDLDLAGLRPQLEKHLNDSTEVVRTAVREALVRITPSRGRKTEIFRAHGGYVSLKAYRAAEIVHDATVAFCNRFVDRRSRTQDQMVQAARSRKHNIVEGSAAAGTSSKTEIRLIGVARASLEELLADYRDFLRQKGLPKWEKGDPQAQEIRRLAYKTHRSYIEAASPHNRGQHGGIAERMLAARLRHRREQQAPVPPQALMGCLCHEA
jgi:four helix bundle protein